MNPSEQKRRVLFVCLGASSDIVNALTVAAALRAAEPRSRIGWVVHPPSRPLVENNPAIHKVHEWRRGGGVAEFRRIVSELRGERYDIAVDLQRMQKSAILARASGAARVLGFDRKRARESSWILTRERITSGPAREHMLLQYARFLPLLGLEPVEPHHSFPHDPSAADWAEALTLGRPAPVVLDLGASSSGERWPAEHFRAVAQAVQEGAGGAPGRPVLLSGEVDDGGVAAEVAADLEVLNLVGETTLAQRLELCKVAHALLTASPTPMQLAAAVGTPTIALYGRDDPARKGPYGPGHIVLQAGRRLTRELTVAADEPAQAGPLEETSPEQAIASLAELENGATAV